MKKLLFSLIALVGMASLRTLPNNDDPTYFDTVEYLALSKKPKNITVRQWCENRADEFVKKSRNKILNILGIDEKEWENKKIALKVEFTKSEKVCKHELCKRCKNFEDKIEVPFPAYFHKKIEKALTSLKQGAEIIDFWTDSNKIINVKLKNGKVVKFLNNPCKCDVGSGMSTEDTVYFCPATHQDDSVTEKALAGIIGHELTHIQKGHAPNTDCLYEAYDKRCNELYGIIEEATKSLQEINSQGLSNKLAGNLLEEKNQISAILEQVNTIKSDFETNFYKAMQIFSIYKEAQADIGIVAYDDPDILLAFQKYSESLAAKDANNKFDSEDFCNCEFCKYEKGHPESIKKCGCNPKDCDSECGYNHPADEIRAKYLKEIREAIIKETKVSKSETKKETKDCKKVKQRPPVPTTKPAPGLKKILLTQTVKQENKQRPQLPKTRPGQNPVKTTLEKNKTIQNPVIPKQGQPKQQVKVSPKNMSSQNHNLVKAIIARFNSLNK